MSGQVTMYPGLMRLWHNAHRRKGERLVQLVGGEVGRLQRAGGEKRKRFPRVTEVLPSIVQHSPLLTALRWLHVEAGCDFATMEAFQMALGIENLREAFDFLLAQKECFRVSGKEGVLTLRDQQQHDHVSVERYEEVVAALLKLDTQTEGLDSLVSCLDQLVKHVDWRKISKRKALLAELADLSWSLKSLSMVVALSPYLQEGGEPLGMARVPRWLETVYYAAVHAGFLRVLAENYVRVDDIPGDDSGRRDLYNRVLSQAIKLSEGLFSFSDELGAVPLEEPPLVGLALATGCHDVLLDVGMSAGAARLGIEAGTPFSVLRELMERLGGFEQPAQWRDFAAQRNLRVVAVSRGGRQVLMIGEEPAGTAEMPIYLLRLKRVAARFEEELLPLLKEEIQATEEALSEGEEGTVVFHTHKMKTIVLGRMRSLYDQLESLVLIIKNSSLLPGAEYCGLNRVEKWRESVRGVAEEAATIQALLERYFGRERAVTMESLASMLIAICDYIAAPRETGGEKKRQELEQGGKVTFGVLQDLFRRAFVSVQVDFTLEPSLGIAEEGVYLSPFCFAGVLRSLVANAQRWGDLSGGVRVVVSEEQSGTITVQVRSPGRIDAPMLEEVSWEEEGRPLATAQRLFVVGTEEEVDDDVIVVGPWAIRDVLEYMQGTVRAFNDEQKGEVVVELTLKHSA